MGYLECTLRSMGQYSRAKSLEKISYIISNNQENQKKKNHKKSKKSQKSREN